MAGLVVTPTGPEVGNTFVFRKVVASPFSLGVPRPRSVNSSGIVCCSVFLETGASSSFRGLLYTTHSWSFRVPDLSPTGTKIEQRKASRITSFRHECYSRSAHLVSGVYRDVIVLKPLSPQARKHLLVLLIFDLLMAGGGRGIQGVCFGCEERDRGWYIQ